MECLDKKYINKIVQTKYSKGKTQKVIIKPSWNVTILLKILLAIVLDLFIIRAKIN